MFNHKLQRGAQDRSFTPIKVSVHRDCSHKELLKKSMSSVWNDAHERGHYYLSDGSGHKITGEDFSNKFHSGESKSVPWTLGNYLQASSVRYPSRARLYCFCSQWLVLHMVVVICFHDSAISFLGRILVRVRGYLQVSQVGIICNHSSIQCFPCI